MTERTLGERRVRTGFNPSAEGRVDRLKRMGASFIDEVNAIPARDGEVARLKAIAMTEIESATSWAVKAATATPEPGESVRNQESGESA